MQNTRKISKPLTRPYLLMSNGSKEVRAKLSQWGKSYTRPKFARHGTGPPMYPPSTQCGEKGVFTGARESVTAKLERYLQTF